jgi:hypothetical protein
MISEKEQILKSIEAKIDQMTRLTEEIMNDIWNGAIEEAAEKALYIGEVYVSEQIRKLKK